MELQAKYIVNKDGKPTSVIIPIEKFREIVESYGIDLTEEERKSISKGRKLRKRKNKEELEKEYTDLDDV